MEVIDFEDNEDEEEREIFLDVVVAKACTLVEIGVAGILEGVPIVACDLDNLVEGIFQELLVGVEGKVEISMYKCP